MTMRSLGLSIYPDHSNFEDNAKYLELGHKYGFSRIFMSMLEVQGSPAETQAKYKKIIEIIELNMSNNVDYLNNIISYQANTPFIYGCHNFYPQRGTALTYDFFFDCIKRFKHFGIHTAAFVSSQVGKMGPWNVEDGLPTLEQDRNLPIDVQAMHLFASGLIVT